MTSAINLSVWFNNCFLFLHKFTTKKFWRIELIAILACTSLFLSTPAFTFIKDSINQDFWKAFEQKRDHPFSALKYDEGTNMAKKNFRLTMPLFARIFHLNDWTIFALQFIASILLLYIALLLAENVTGDPVCGILTTIGLTFIYSGHAGFIDLLAWFDEFAFLFLAMAMFSKKSYLVFLWIQLACWVDERAIIASGFVFIWWKLQELTLNGFTLKSFFRAGLNSSFTVIAVVVYFITRLLIKYFAHIPSPLGNVGAKVLLLNTDFIGIGVWESLEGFWLLAIVGTLLLLKERRLFLGFLILLLMFIILISALSVFDITRSAAYMFPVIFIFLYVMKEKFSLADIRNVLLISATICFLFPCYYIVSPRIFWCKPLIIRIIDYFKSRWYGIPASIHLT